MKISALILGIILVAGTALSGNALARGGHDDRSWAKGNGHYERWDRRDHHRGHGYRKGWHRGHEHREYRPRYRDARRHHDHGDVWYGLHLFLGGY